MEKELLELIMKYKGMFITNLLPLISICNSKDYKRIKQLMKELHYD